jgi:outer membrane lipoprotein-sorting protein
METAMRPTRRTLTLALAAAPLFAAGLAVPAFAQAEFSPEDQALVKRARDYLQDLTTAQARFVQTDWRGQTSQGDFYLQRPGKARFAYDPPSGLTVVSNGKTVFVADSRLKTFNHYPLFATPLSIFLAKNVRLDRGVEVTEVDRMADGFTLVARDPDRPTAGQIALTFTDNPLALDGWAVTDAQRRTTRVRLQGLKRVPSLDPELFQGRDPRQAGGA